ncbi:MAG: hypothetical protein NTV22_11920 [bacterium]|nr:hypothetical protein [bacterium]
MLAVKAEYDGQAVVFKQAPHVLPGPIIVIFESDEAGQGEFGALWLKAQERAFAKTWDNDADAVYDTM